MIAEAQCKYMLKLANDILKQVLSSSVVRVVRRRTGIPTGWPAQCNKENLTLATVDLLSVNLVKRHFSCVLTVFNCFMHIPQF